MAPDPSLFLAFAPKPRTAMQLCGIVCACEMHTSMCDPLTVYSEKFGTVVSVKIPRPAADNSPVPGLGKVTPLQLGPLCVHSLRYLSLGTRVLVAVQPPAHLGTHVQARPSGRYTSSSTARSLPPRRATHCMGASSTTALWRCTSMGDAERVHCRSFLQPILHVP